MSPLALGPILALLGVVAAFYILRRKAKVRKSMYRTLREQREHDLRKARARATAAKAATETAAIQKEQEEHAAAERAAAAAAAPPAGPVATASIEPTVPVSEWQSAPAQVPESTPPAPETTPLQPTITTPEPEPVPVAEPEPEPAPVPEPEPEPVQLPEPEPMSEPTPEPEPVPGPEPAPEPEAAPTGKASWEIVEPAGHGESVKRAAEAAGAASGSRADWELDSSEQERAGDRLKRGGGGNRSDDRGGDDDEALGGETLGQTLLSYAGLVAALLVILLGILFMIGSRTG